MKRILKNWTTFEIGFIVLSLFVITASFIIGKDKNYLSFVTSIVGAFNVNGC